MIIQMPLRVEMGIRKPKRYYFNLNNYRNWHYQVSNKLKAMYKDILESKVKGMLWEIVDIEFTLHMGSRRRVDRSNVLSIHEKFFCDGLVDLGCISDDRDKFINSTHYYTGAVDPDNPRVDIKISEI